MLAGPIVNALDYHWLFWIPGVVVAVAAVATYFVVPESPVRTPGRISWLAAVLLSGWLVALLVAVSEAPTGAGARLGHRAARRRGRARRRLGLGRAALARSR